MSIGRGLGGASRIIRRIGRRSGIGIATAIETEIESAGTGTGTGIVTGIEGTEETETENGIGIEKEVEIDHAPLRNNHPPSTGTSTSTQIRAAILHPSSKKCFRQRNTLWAGCRHLQSTKAKWTPQISHRPAISIVSCLRLFYLTLAISCCASPYLFLVGRSHCVFLCIFYPISLCFIIIVGCIYFLFVI